MIDKIVDTFHDAVVKSDPMAIPYFVIVCLIVFLSYKVIVKFGTSFVQAHQKLADSIAGLKDVMTAFMDDEKSHKEEVITKLQVIDQKLNDITEERRQGLFNPRRRKTDKESQFYRYDDTR